MQRGGETPLFFFAQLQVIVRMATRWRFLLDHFAKTFCREPEELWIEEFTFVPGLPFERMLGVVVKELPDSFQVMLPGVPVVEARVMGGASKDADISLKVELIRTTPVLRVYKNQLLYSSSPAKEIHMEYLKLLLDNSNDLLDLPIVLKSTERYHSFEGDADNFVADLMEEIHDMEKDCAARPELLSKEGILYIKQTVLDIDFEDNEVDNEEESEAPTDGNKTLH